MMPSLTLLIIFRGKGGDLNLKDSGVELMFRQVDSLLESRIVDQLFNEINDQAVARTDV